MPKKSGEHLQNLVRIIEQVTHRNADVAVESPKYFEDKDTGRKREHDVVLTFKSGHHELIVALECRDRSRKTGVSEIEAFHAKCQRTGIDRGIVVSTTGFWKSALAKAKSYNIGCLTLEEAKVFDWCLTPGMIFVKRNVDHTDVRIIPAEDIKGEFEVFWNDGRKLTTEMIPKIGLSCLQQLEFDKTRELDGIYWKKFNVLDPGMYIVDESEKKTGVSSMHIAIKYSVKNELVPFDFREYVDLAKGNQIGSAAIAKLDAPEAGIEGDLIILHKEDEGAMVSYVPRKQK